MFILLPYIQGRIQRARNDIPETLPQGLERFISPSKEGAGVLIRTLQRGDESVEFQRPKIQDLVKVSFSLRMENEIIEFSRGHLSHSSCYCCCCCFCSDRSMWSAFWKTEPRLTAPETETSHLSSRSEPNKSLKAWKLLFSDSLFVS